MQVRQALRDVQQQRRLDGVRQVDVLVALQELGQVDGQFLHDEPGEEKALLVGGWVAPHRCLKLFLPFPLVV